MFSRSLVFIVLLLGFGPVLANVGLLQHFYPLTLSDGSQIDVTPVGDRDHHWLETRDGRKLLQRGGYWFYAKQDHNGVVSITNESLVAGIMLPDLTPLPAAQVEQSLVQAFSAEQTQRIPYRYPSSSSYFRQNLLVVRVSFTDQGFRYSNAEVAEQMFGSQSSVRHFFQENSYGRFDIQPVNENHGTVNDGIVSVVLSRKHPDFGSGFGTASQNLALEALNALPQDLNLSVYDKNRDSWLDPNELAVVFLVAGYEQAFAGAGTTRPRIWAHKSSLYQGQVDGMRVGEYAMFGERHQGNLATIGIICHELGHLLFDLPDLYDRYGKSMGVGRWGLMGLGGWNSVAGPAGNQPAHMLGWSKEQAGFVSLSQVTEGTNNLRLRAVSDGPDVLEVHLDGYRHGQRIILEHRRQDNYDLGLPGEGVLVTRIDDWVGYGPLGNQNDDVNHQLVNVEEADGGSDLDQNRNRGDANDVFRSASGDTLFSAVSPSPAANELPNVVELLAMEAGIVADVTLQVSNPVFGSNLGYDDVGPNSSWGELNSTAQVLLELDLDSNVVWMDGLDWFALGNGLVDVEIYQHDPRNNDEQALLWQESDFPVVAGWNRLMLNQRLPNKGYQRVFLVLTSRSTETRPLAIDEQGSVSGRTLVKRDLDQEFQPANFDVAARLLVMNRDAPVATFLNRGDVSRSAGGSSSGGGSLWVLLILLLVPAVRRV